MAYRYKATRTKRQIIEQAKSLLNGYILDTETTGIGSEDEIVQLGIIGANEEVIYNTFFNPKTPIGAKAEEVHGISMSQVSSCPSFGQEAERVTNILKMCRPLVIYNAPFDLKLLKQTFANHDLNGKSNFIDSLKVFDAMILIGEFFQDSMGYYSWIKLTTAYNRLCPDRGYINAHNAIADCVMTQRCLAKIVEHRLVEG